MAQTIHRECSLIPILAQSIQRRKSNACIPNDDIQPLPSFASLVLEFICRPFCCLNRRQVKWMEMYGTLGLGRIAFYLFLGKRNAFEIFVFVQ